MNPFYEWLNFCIQTIYIQCKGTLELSAQYTLFILFSQNCFHNGFPLKYFKLNPKILETLGDDTIQNIIIWKK